MISVRDATKEKDKKLLEPEQSALIVAYSVANQRSTTGEQMIWQRTLLFVAVNSLILTAAHNLSAEINPFGFALIGGLGVTYAAFWYDAMARQWAYHRLMIRVLKELERKLHLDGEPPLGSWLRGDAALAGRDESFVFPKPILRVKSGVAQGLNQATTILFFLAYLMVGCFNIYKVFCP